MRYTTFTERGCRSDNEDYCQVVIDNDAGRHLFVVCDGMGGHAMGEVASRVVGTAICEYWEQASFGEGVEQVLANAFQKASEALDAKADIFNHVEMGTTMVLAAICGSQLTIAHAGDSRCYLLRPPKGVVHRTEDHMNQSVWGNYIDRSFFSYQRDKAKVEMRQLDLQDGDRVFLCTDGVYQCIDPDILVQRCIDDKSPEKVADVIKFLCEKFSNDNYSGILVYYNTIRQAQIEDYETILSFYDDVITGTPNISSHARWSKGKHPTAESIRAYIEEGSMYLYTEDGRIAGAMAVTMYQGEDYHAIEWSQPVEDHEAAVIHILAVSPDYQGKGIGTKMIQEAVRLSKTNGKKAIRLDALASNTPAHRIYKRLGFEYRGKQHLYAENTGWTDFYFFELIQ